MKKVLSVVLALCLTLLICVPAFAAPEDGQVISQETDDSATVVVQTTDWENAAWYTITIPASIEIPWEGTPEEAGGDNFTWSYESQLFNGQHLEVWLDKNAGTMTAQDSVFTLDYTLDGTVPVETEPFCTAGQLANGSQTTSVLIADSEWAAAAVGEYTDILTFNVAVSDTAHTGA